MKSQNTISKSLITTGFSILLGLGATQTLLAGDASDQYYRNILFNPDKSLLLAESRGRVTIYDGLESEVVDRAMESQFDRIQNMMFVGVRHTQSDGSVEVEQDGCDS
jgi:hypothetical protein